MYFRCLLLLLALGLVVPQPSAQTTNILNLCTEAALRAALEIGGDYRIECGTNATTINLTEPLIVRRDINLVSTNELLLSGQNLTRIMIVEPGVQLTLSNVLFFNGRQTETNLNSGGIPDTAGGAIYNDGGHVTILRSRFAGNTVIGITGSPGGQGENGEHGGDAAGAAIFNNAGQIIVSNVVFEANSATGGVGGSGGDGRSAGLGQNGGRGGDGGSAGGAAIYSSGGAVFVYASTFTNNTTIGASAGTGGLGGGTLGFPGQAGEAGDGVGAALSGVDAEVTIYASTFITNSVRGADGLDAPDATGRLKGENGRNGGDGAGGAIYSTGGLWVTNCTFFGNLAVSGNGGAGGAGSPGGFGGDGGNGGNGGFATGGAIESAGPAVIVNSTFSDNLLDPGLGGNSGPGAGLGDDGSPGSTGPGRGGALYASGSEVTIANSILANSATTIEGNVKDLGGNISTDLNPLVNSFASFRLTNPFLLPLANNGGPTPTMAITTNSPGIDAGLSEFCPGLDQRGTNRAGNCDIGAFELSATLPPIPDEIFTNDNFHVFHSTNDIIVRWAAGYSNLVLEETTNLHLTNIVWTPVTDTSNIRQSNNFNFLTITPEVARPRTFYRLAGHDQPNPAATNTPPIP